MLKLYSVRYYGDNGGGLGIVAAGDDNEAREIVGDELEESLNVESINCIGTAADSLIPGFVDYFSWENS